MNPTQASVRTHLTVRLLEPGPGAGTTELLGLAAAVVGDEESAVELDEGLLEEVLGVLIDVLLVVGDQGLGDGLTDGVDLRGVTTTGDTDADVDWSNVSRGLRIFTRISVLGTKNLSISKGPVFEGNRVDIKISGRMYLARTCRGRGRGGARRPCSGGWRAGRCRRNISVWAPRRNLVIWRGLLTGGEGGR